MHADGNLVAVQTWSQQNHNTVVYKVATFDHPVTATLNTPRKMTVNLNVPEQVEISIEKATSLGLIVNELVTNSLKHVEEHIDL